MTSKTLFQIDLSLVCVCHLMLSFELFFEVTQGKGQQQTKLSMTPITFSLAIIATSGNT
jgi:hypothetical protein